MFTIVYTTTSSKKEAEKIAKALVEGRLAACVNYFPIKSMYVWKGKISYDDEYVLLCKTVKSNFSKVKKKIKQLHSYELPCVFSIKIENGDAKYLRWIREAVK